MGRLQSFYLKSSRLLGKLASVLFFLSSFFYRKSFLVNQLRIKKELSRNRAIDEKSLSERWRGIRINPDWIRYYNSVERETSVDSFDTRFIPLDIQYCFIDNWFNDTESALHLDDKNMYDLYFHDVNRPVTVGRIIGGAYFDSRYNRITLAELVDRCVKVQRVIMKPTVMSSTGNGIVFWDVAEGAAFLESFLIKHKNYIIQELIIQHEDMNRLYRGSVNSIRIVTCCIDENPVVLSGVVRMGANGCKLDNSGKGGLFCGIHDDGSLKKYGYSKDGKTFVKHPEGGVFADCRIPNYSQCKEQCLTLSNRFYRISKLISWDFAVDQNGNPMLIEVNLCYGGADIHQIANGPLYGEKTDEVLDRIFRKNKKYSFCNKVLSVFR